MKVRPLVATLLFCLVLAPRMTAALAADPKLVVLITVDQLRGDRPLRFKDRFGDGGFRYLLDNGTVYTQAHYRHATTLTAVGHATLVTGGNTGQHGMAGNDWFDQASGQKVYCVEDDRHHLIGGIPQPHSGTSPRNLMSTTFGDELALASGSRSRVFSVSIKDRGAIIPAGNLGKAFWYAKNSGQFVTSTFYYQAYPKWAEAWNGEKRANAYKQATWKLMNDRSTYLFAERDDRPVEVSYKRLGRTFPHPLANPKPADFYATLSATPMGDELTLDFAKTLIKAERLGQGDATDVLAISFSCTDYIGHAFGPDSLEAEDNLIRLDRTLADLLAFIDKSIGLEQTLVVLSSDHGISENPEYMIGLGVPAGRHDVMKLLATLNLKLRDKLHVDVDLVKAFHNPSLYLDLAAVAAQKLDVAAVERVLAAEVLGQPGFAYALTRTDLAAGNVSDKDPILAKMLRAFHPTRSGNVLVAQSPLWYLGTSGYAAMHGSPYAYDTYVPLMFAGAGIPAQSVARPVGPEDVAATIAGILDIKPPSGSTGTALVEVLAAGAIDPPP